MVSYLLLSNLHCLQSPLVIYWQLPWLFNDFPKEAHCVIINRLRPHSHIRYMYSDMSGVMFNQQRDRKTDRHAGVATRCNIAVGARREQCTGNIWLHSPLLPLMMRIGRNDKLLAIGQQARKARERGRGGDIKSRLANSAVDSCWRTEWVLRTNEKEAPNGPQNGN